jgi:hypothetical protein
LRNNLKWLSFGDVNVLRVEVMQLLEEEPPRRSGTAIPSCLPYAVIDAMQERLDRAPETMRIRRQTAERLGSTKKVLIWLEQFLWVRTTRVIGLRNPETASASALTPAPPGSSPLA